MTDRNNLSWRWEYWGWECIDPLGGRLAEIQMRNLNQPFSLYCLLLLKLIRTGLDVAMGMDGDLEGATISKSIWNWEPLSHREVGLVMDPWGAPWVFQGLDPVGEGAREWPNYRVASDSSFYLYKERDSDLLASLCSRETCTWTNRQFLSFTFKWVPTDWITTTISIAM